jgi:malate dehydrogenase
MSRDDLIETNSVIVKHVTEQIIEYSPCAIIIVVSNPLDVMTYQAYITSKFPRTRVMGMAGILDTGRYKAFIADELNVSPKDISALLLGGHGDTMVPLPRYTTVSGIPVTELIDPGKLDAIVERTRFGGGELVKLMGTSAWYAPGSAAARMAEAVIRNHKRVFPCCVKLEGEYGLENVFVGVPVILGRNGIERIIELKLTDKETEMLHDSARAVKETMDVLDKMEEKNR